MFEQFIDLYMDDALTRPGQGPADPSMDMYVCDHMWNVTRPVTQDQ
jgi:hypothetical protein